MRASAPIKTLLQSLLAITLILATTEFLWYEQLSDDSSFVETDTSEKEELKEEVEGKRRSEFLLDGLDYALQASIHQDFQSYQYLFGRYQHLTSRPRIAVRLYLRNLQLKIPSPDSLT